MAKPPVQLNPLTGTSGNDVLFMTHAAYSAGAFNIMQASGLGGDDTIVRDRTGGYNVLNGAYNSANLYGGSGFDIVSYAGSAYALSANLTQGIAHSDTPNHLNVAFAPDFLHSIEGLVGSAHGDHIIGDGGANRLYGHDGDDFIWGEGGHDTIWGGQGADVIYGGAGQDKLYGENGADRMHGGDGADLMYGGDGQDEMYGDGGNDVLFGDNNNDKLYGGAGNDTIYGGNGDDHLYGGIGNDNLHVGAGNDVAYGGLGADRFHVSGTGNNALYGGSGADWVEYSGNAPVIVSLWGGTATRTDGADTLNSVENVQTGGGNDIVFGTAGTNRIFTGGGDDVIYTMGGKDEVRAGSGRDVVVGYGGAETIYGEAGDDRLYGGGGTDTISGGSGKDFIQGGDGDDDLWGGSEADTFHFASADGGVDRIRDFSAGEDKLSFGSGYFEGQSLGGFSVAKSLWAYAWGGEVSLYADRAGLGLTQIAVLDGVNANTINQKIANGTIFSVATSDVAGGAPGGLAPLAPIAVFEPVWDVVA